MAKLKTNISRSEKKIVSQNTVTKSYAAQLQSVVVSAEHKMAILNEITPEVTAFRQKPGERLMKQVASSGCAALASYAHIRTGGQVSAPSLNKTVDRSIIQTQQNTDYLKTARLTYSESAKTVIVPSDGLEKKMKIAGKKYHRKVVRRAVGIKQMRLKNKKYTIARNSDDNLAAESVQTVSSVAAGAVQTGGMLRTIVKNTAGAAGHIATAVKTRKIFTRKSSVKDLGRIAMGVGGGIKNIAKDTGAQLLKTKIDKSTVTDTGTEALKQGATELRYVDNARKAVVNTARTATKAGYAVKNMPKNTRVQMKKIQKNAKRTAEATKKVAAFIKKLVTSKAFWIVLGVAALLLIVILLLVGLVTVIVAAVTSLFSWLCPDDTEAAKTEREMLNGYKTAIVEYVDEKQSEIDAIVDGFFCDHISYPPYSEISELNQYGTKEIVIDDYDPIIAILAVLKYREMQGNPEDLELKFTDAEIEGVVDKFYTFEYHYEYANCSGHNCKRRITRTTYNAGTENEYTVTTTTYYCDCLHQWLYGEVTNHTLVEVLASYGFNEDEKELYEMYLEQIKIMLEES